MSAKRSLFTTDGAGPSRVVVQIEHIDENSPSSKKPRARKDVNQRRKPAPKTIEFQLNGSLNSPAPQYPWQTATPTNLGSTDQTEKEEDNPFENWRDDFNDVAQATQSVEPVDETDETDKASQRKVSKLANIICFAEKYVYVHPDAELSSSSVESALLRLLRASDV
ncbi:hypothetical protein FRC08_007075 [Ceratobasidium sp. 394]|nr:hypothetical protein FRC08_007075 [Ceratobasidium sp. 394]